MKVSEGGFLHRLLNRVDVSKASGMPAQAAPYLYNVESVGDQGVGPATDTESYLQQYGTAGWVYICGNRVAKKCASTDFALFTTDSEGTKQYVKQHVLLDVMARPNDMMSQMQLRMLLHLHMELAGEAFWYINTNVVGGPAQIYPLIPSFIKIVPGGPRGQMIKGYIYDVMGQIVTFKPEEIIHFFYPNPDPGNFYRGASPLSALRYTLAAHQNAEIYNYQFFRNSAQPGGYLSTDHSLDRQEVNRLRRMWEQQQRGQNNWHKVAVATNGLRFQEVGISHKDMDFVNQMENARETILAAFGVPKSQVGLVQDVNKATAQSDESNFGTQTIGPALANIASTLNTFLMPLYGDSIQCEFLNILPRDEALLLEKHKTYVTTAVMTINDVRRDLGLPTVAWGDEPIIPVNFVPLQGHPLLGNNPNTVDPSKSPAPPGVKDQPISDKPPGNGNGNQDPAAKAYIAQVIQEIYKEANLAKRLGM
jgi:HK97 family phage portal protein